MLRSNLILLAFLIVIPAPALGQASSSDRLEELERQIEESRAQLEEQEAEYERLTQEVEALRHRSIEIVAEVQALEVGILAIEARLVELRDAEGVVVADLDRRRIALVDILAALQSIERNKPPALVVRPEDAVAAVRSAMLLSSVLPELEAQASGLRTQLEALTLLRNTIESEQADFTTAAEALAREEAGLDSLLAERRALSQELAQSVESGRDQLVRFAAEAEDLRGLIRRLTRRFSDVSPMLRPPPGARPEPSATVRGRFAQALGSLRMPAVGRVLRGFGDILEPGTHSQGVALVTRAGARVVAPFDSEIVFAAPYRGYGQLLILSPGDGYLILLSGLARIDGVVGQQLLTGEPVGIMGSETLAPNVQRWAVSEETTEEGRPVLYLEMREDGEPVDPLPWFREDQWRVDGT